MAGESLNIHIPQSCTHTYLMRTLGRAGALEGEWEHLVIHMPNRSFILISTVAFLCAWGLRQRLAGRTFEFTGNGGPLNYLSRLNLFKHLDFSHPENFERHTTIGRFIPLLLFDDDRTVFQASNAICDLVLRNFDNGREFLPALEWAVYEVLDNVNLHAETPVPGVVCAQFYPGMHRIDIAICDTGRGVRASLSESILLNSHEEALSKALQRGVTRNPNIGQGNGLAGVLEIARQNEGGFYLWSGDTVYSSTEAQLFKPVPLIPGTGVMFRLDTQHPVDLSRTFIGENAFSFIDAEGERIQEGGGLLIKDECLNTGTRSSAQPLRRKIMALLPDYEGTLLLDFDGVGSASSSFLDELLGRLVIELGEQVFRERVKLANISKQLIDMTNVVIGQRLQT